MDLNQYGSKSKQLDCSSDMQIKVFRFSKL